MSSIFDPDDEPDGTVGGETAITGDFDSAADASPSAIIELSGSHDGTDGSDYDWSSTIDVSADIALDATASSTTMTEDEDAG